MRPQERPPEGQIRAPKLSGRYSVSRLIGKGAQARVYLAFDARLKQWRAVKVLAASFVDDAQVRARFEAEAQVLAKLSHPNLMRVVDIDREGRVPYLVMELARGGSVLDWCKRHGAMPPALVLQVASQCAEGLHHAHEQGIVHRDVKPHNVLIRDDGRIVLTDFGIAQIAEGDHLTATGAAMGTFAFMAPEQRSDAKSVDRRADVYGLGSTIFTLLTLRTSAELFFAEVRDQLLGDIPVELQPLILDACRYERDQRFPTMRAFQEAMARLLERMEPHAGPVLFEEVVRLPAEPPSSLGPEANVGDLVAAIGEAEPAPTGRSPASVAPGRYPASVAPGRYPASVAPGRSPASVAPGRSPASVAPGQSPASVAPGRSSKSVVPPERPNEDVAAVIPYRMPERVIPRLTERTPDAAEELPDYVDQNTLPPPPRVLVAPLPPTIEKKPDHVIGDVPLEVVEERGPVNRSPFVVMGACALLVASLLGAGLYQKTQASAARQSAGEDLVQVVDEFGTLPDELARSGADAAPLRDLYFGFQDARGATKVDAAVSFVEAAVAAESEVGASALAQSQIRQLAQSLDQYRAADEKWRKAKASRVSRLTGDLGLY